MAFERAERLTIDRFPQPDRPIITRGRKGLPIWAPGNAVHCTVVTFDSAKQSTTGCLPQSDRPVFTRGREGLAVGTPGDRGLVSNLYF